MIPLLENRDFDSKLCSINVNLRYQKSTLPIAEGSKLVFPVYTRPKYNYSSIN